MTAKLKDERGGGDIISHYRSRERDALWSSGVGARTGTMSSSPTRPELSCTSFSLPSLHKP